MRAKIMGGINVSPIEPLGGITTLPYDVKFGASCNIFERSVTLDVGLRGTEVIWRLVSRPLDARVSG